MRFFNPNVDLTIHLPCIFNNFLFLLTKVVLCRCLELEKEKFVHRVNFYLSLKSYGRNMASFPSSEIV